MIIFITVLILLACVILGFLILVQNPQGGGLTGSFGSISSQVMGVKQSNDVMEKGTWTMVGILAGLCIISVMFFEKPKTDDGNGRQQTHRNAPAQQQKAPAGNGLQKNK